MAVPRRWLLTAAILPLALVAASPAAASPTWSAPTDSPTSAASSHALAFDEAGSATATWVRSGSDGTSIWAASQASGASTFGTAARVSSVAPSDGAVASEPAIAVDAQGDGVIAWTAEPSTGATQAVQLSMRVGKSGAWSAPTTVSMMGSAASSPTVAFSATGAALVAWYQEGSDYSTAMIDTVAVASGTVSPLQTISAYVSDPHLAFNRAGAGVLTWKETSVSFSPPYTGKTVLRAAVRKAGVTTFPTPGQQVFTTGATSAQVDTSAAAMDEAGNANAAWSTISTDDGHPMTVYGSVRGASATSWSGYTLSTAGANQPSIAASSASGAVVAWVEPAAGSSATDRGAIKAAHRAAGATTWTTAAAVSAPGTVAMAPAFAAGTQGTTVATWIRRPGTGDAVQGAALAAGDSTFSAPQDLNAAGAAVTAPAVAVDGNGNAVAIWGRSNATAQIARLDGSSVVAATPPPPAPSPDPTPTPTTPAATTPDPTPGPDPTPTPDPTPDPTTPAATTPDPAPVPTTPTSSSPDPSPSPTPTTGTTPPPATTPSGTSPGTTNAGPAATAPAVSTGSGTGAAPKPVVPAPTGSTVGVWSVGVTTVGGSIAAAIATAARDETLTVGAASPPSLRAFKAKSARRFSPARVGDPLVTRGTGLKLAVASNVAGTLKVVVTRAPAHGKAENLRPVISLPLAAGTTKLVFTGRLAGKPLPAGRYRLKAAVVDASGRASNRRVVTIAING